MYTSVFHLSCKSTPQLLKLRKFNWFRIGFNSEGKMFQNCCFEVIDRRFPGIRLQLMITSIVDEW